MGKWHCPEEKLELIQATQTSGKSIREACEEAGGRYQRTKSIFFLTSLFIDAYS